jgi:hypothetical protein
VDGSDYPVMRQLGIDDFKPEGRLKAADCFRQGITFEALCHNL